MKQQEGRFGKFGGRYAPETLMTPLIELEEAFRTIVQTREFRTEMSALLRDFVGRPTPLTCLKRLTEQLGGAKIYVKREDLAHTGAHKINNSVGQVLLARKMGKTRIVAETGAGQHGVATAAAAALFGIECVIYMGRVDMERQSPNVQRMKLLGAQVIPVDHGTKTLKDAVSEAMRDWVTHIRSTYYVLGSALGPHPYPTLVREFQSVIGTEARSQLLQIEGRLPTEVVACVGGGSNAIGIFSAFIDTPEVLLTGVEAGGEGVETGRHAARISGGSPGVLQGTYTYLLQDDKGQIRDTHSISAGLDYPALGPEHADLFERGRARYVSVTDRQALDAFHLLSRTQGIIPALESSHAIAYVTQRAPELAQDQILLINLSGRGDKDLETVLKAQGESR